MGQKQRYSKENYRKMAHVVAPTNFKKRKHKSFKCEFPSLKLRLKAESVEVFDNGLTTNIDTVYFFRYSSKTPAFKSKVFFFLL